MEERQPASETQASPTSAPALPLARDTLAQVPAHDLVVPLTCHIPSYLVP